MKRVIIFFFCLTNLHLYAQKAIIYYEGLSLYPIDYYAYEFQSLIELHSSSNPICVINDTVFLSFLIRKIETVERCMQEGECIDATFKPTAMIQVVYIRDKYCYYTLNMSSFGEYSSLTIDGKSYIPDEELQNVIVEIVKYCKKNKGQIPIAKLHAVIKGETDDSNPYWPLLFPN